MGPGIVKNFETAFKLLGIMLVGAGVFIGGGGALMWNWLFAGDDNGNKIEVELDLKTIDLAPHGAVTPEMVCAEINKFNVAMNLHFVKASDAEQSPALYFMTERDCVKALNVMNPQLRTAPQP